MGSLSRTTRSKQIANNDNQGFARNRTRELLIQVSQAPGHLGKQVWQFLAGAPFDAITAKAMTHLNL